MSETYRDQILPTLAWPRWGRQFLLVLVAVVRPPVAVVHPPLRDCRFGGSGLLMAGAGPCVGQKEAWGAG